MRPADLKHPEVVAGMAALVALLQQVATISSETCLRFNDPDVEKPENWVDGRDYKKIAKVAEKALHQNFVEGSPERRQGFLLALADMLSIVGDGFAVSDDWNPAATLGRALRGQAAAVRRARRKARIEPSVEQQETRR